MAKKSALEGPKLLRKMIPMVKVYWDTGTNLWDVLGPSSNWNLINNGPGSEALLVYQDYFDIQGYRGQEQLTAFIQGVSFQESNIYQAAGLAAGVGAIHQWDMLTKQKVDDEDFIFMHGYFIPPGFRESLRTLDEVFFGRNRTLGPDAAPYANLVTKNVNLWGAGVASAGDRLHITRIIKLGANFEGAVQELIVPSAAVIATVVVDAEPEYVMLERMRRSYNRHRGG